MSQIALRPAITLAAGTDEARARALVDKAHDQCFVANSITTRVHIEPRFSVREV